MTGHSPHILRESQPLRLGISRCLLGEPVRYDGGHKRDQFLVDILGKYVEWVPVCPEVEAGFGTPRESMRLIDDLAEPRLITIRSGTDNTNVMRRYAKTRLQDLRSLNLSGYVFKKNSPSCGAQRVRVYTREGHGIGNGKGIFANAFQHMFPLVPIEEEDRLQDERLRENFIERVFGYHRWKSHTRNGRLSKRALVSFHTSQKYLVLAHSRHHYQKLAQLMANAHPCTPRQLATLYGQLFMEALAVKTTVRKHMNVLLHLTGHLKGLLNSRFRVELHEVIHAYHQGLVPLSVPITLLRHYAKIFDVPYLQDQTYLNPHPKELLLGNHV